MLAGLGNPGRRYSSTRHNVGFMAVDFICERLGADFRENICFSLVAKAKFEGEEVVLAKPQTYMNLSGAAVSALLKHFSINTGDLTVIHDDVDIPLGKVKEKISGGSAGHKGVASIIEGVGTGDFRRLRMGVGRPAEGVDTDDHVLSPFGKDERSIIAETFENCYRLAISF